ncbi:hypothetical protein SUGI_0028690, partial [Cryptomeria japonica]
MEGKLPEGRTCLHVAVLAGDPDLLRELASKLDVKELIKEEDNQGDTPSHVAVRIYEGSHAVNPQHTVVRNIYEH